MKKASVQNLTLTVKNLGMLMEKYLHFTLMQSAIWKKVSQNTIVHCEFSNDIEQKIVGDKDDLLRHIEGVETFSFFICRILKTKYCQLYQVTTFAP